MTVSVVLPVYNGAETLAQSIASIVRQDSTDWELILIDDASSDRSYSTAEVFARDDSRVRLIRHNANKGLAATLNEGLELARGEFVARLDQDDEALPSRLRLQAEYLQEHPGVAVVGSFVFHMGADARFDRLVELPSSPRDVARRLHQENCLYHPAVMLRRSVVVGAGGYHAEFRNAEDYELWLRLSRSHDLANLDVPLLRYRFSTSGMTLGRKWEQLYYVHLAQEMNRGEGVAPEVAAERAEARLKLVDRRRFMHQVVVGTLREFVRLRLWDDGRELLRAMNAELGTAETYKLWLWLRAAKLRYGVL